MKVLVTGGSGFLGSHIADELSARGYVVTIFDYREPIWRNPQHSIVVGDITDPEQVEASVRGHDYVFHLAALADLNDVKTRPVDTWRINIGGTLNMLEACRKCGVDRLLFASTVYVYSRDGGFYRCSKQACENYIEEYGRVYGLRYTILRYGSLYGPRSDHANGVYRLLSEALSNRAVVCAGGPNDIRSYIHARDAASLSVDAMADEYSGEHLVLTGHDSLRLRDLIRLFEELIGCEIEVTYDGLGDSQGRNGHYSMTPYAYTPKPGKKLVANPFVDIGQGLLEMVELIDRAEKR